MILDSGPKPTENLQQAKLDLDKFGFCFIPNVLVGNELTEARDRLLDQAEAEEELANEVLALPWPFPMLPFALPPILPLPLALPPLSPSS